VNLHWEIFLLLVGSRLTGGRLSVQNIISAQYYKPCLAEEEETRWQDISLKNWDRGTREDTAESWNECLCEDADLIQWVFKFFTALYIDPKRTRERGESLVIKRTRDHND
jgi:hypothetical protein